MLLNNLLMASLALGSSALFLGLAVLGWGGFDAFFSHPAFIAVLVVFVVALGASTFTQGNLSSGLATQGTTRFNPTADLGGLMAVLAGFRQ